MSNYLLLLIYIINYNILYLDISSFLYSLCYCLIFSSYNINSVYVYYSYYLLISSSIFYNNDFGSKISDATSGVFCKDDSFELKLTFYSYMFFRMEINLILHYIYKKLLIFVNQ